VDVYSFLLPLEGGPGIDLSFPSLSNEIYRNVEPVQR
jgi:hypothetical protein